MKRRSLLKSALMLSLLPVAGCASLKKVETEMINKVLSDLRLFERGLSKFIDSAEVKAKADLHDFEKLVVTKVAVMIAVNKIEKEPHNVREIIGNVLSYLDDAILIITSIMNYLPIPAPFPMILTALKTILPFIISAVKKQSDTFVYTGMTPEQARAFLATV